MKSKKTDLDPIRIERCAEYFRTLAHPMRIKIVDMLEGGPKCVGEIQKVLKIAQPPTSHHLKLMTKIGVLKYRRAGKNTYYSLAPGIVQKTLRLVDQITK